MKSRRWKRNAVIAVVAVFVAAGVWLNWTYTRPEAAPDTPELAETWNRETLAAGEEPEAIGAETVDALTEDVVVLDDDVWGAVVTQAETDTAMADYFAAIRLARQESRDSAVSLLQETIAYETGEDGEAASQAQSQLGTMVDTALREAEIEGLVIAKGYEDCVTYMADQAVSVAVAAPEEGLSEEAVAQICDIVTTQSGYSPSQLRIIEVR